MNGEHKLRKAPTPYWRYAKLVDRPSPEERLRAEALAKERAKMDLTARVMGDPLPGRSALAQRDKGSI